MEFTQWNGFKGSNWKREIDVRDFIINNYKPYYSDGKFLSGPTERTKDALERLEKLKKLEQERGGVLDIDTQTVSGINAYGPGKLIDDDIILGLQTDEPLKREVNAFGGIRMARQACEAYGYEVGQEIEDVFARKVTHNEGVFTAYTDEMKAARHCALLTGLPDAYGRGRIIGDYRRIALYGVDKLIEFKLADKKAVGERGADNDTIQLLEEIGFQIKALKELKAMALSYCCDISMPASNAREAIQWTYFGYLAANKEQNGAAMSVGRVDAFFDIYIEKELQEGTLTESAAQELIDDFVLKLRCIRHLRMPEYNELFAGDPVWATVSIGGVGSDHRALVTRTSYRLLNTLYNLGPAPEPNLTILWSEQLPFDFKEFCAKASCDTDAIQYENDDLMRNQFGDDYGIACCVSAMKLGKQMQFFGARTNLAKLLLLAINGGIDNKFDTRIGPQMEVITDEVLDYEKVMNRFNLYLSWLCNLYVKTMNTIHWSHDRYCYENIQMALHDSDVERLMAFGIAGFSVLVDSLSAIKYAKVMPIKDEHGIVVDFETVGDFPKYGNDDDRVDHIAQEVAHKMITELRKTPTYRGARHTMSILTITSNVMYGKKTGATPEGRKAGEPFAPGANPMHGREHEGALAALNSVAKIPYCDALDGISNTFSIIPSTLGNSDQQRVTNLVNILDGYFGSGAHHLNVNVMNRQTLLDAFEHPEDYPNLTIRVSGYAVRFCTLTKEQQREVIKRTFHENM